MSSGKKKKVNNIGINFSVLSFCLLVVDGTFTEIENGVVDIKFTAKNT